MMPKRNSQESGEKSHKELYKYRPWLRAKDRKKANKLKIILESEENHEKEGILETVRDREVKKSFYDSTTVDLSSIDDFDSNIDIPFGTFDEEGLENEISHDPMYYGQDPPHNMTYYVPSGYYSPHGFIPYYGNTMNPIYYIPNNFYPYPQ
jgi:hypothetical protein